MDRGPRPMKNLKVTELNRNCVDRFRDAHQAEYEAREKLSEHDLERVRQHTITYPRLGVELNKRKSLSKVRTIEQNNDSYKRQNDGVCAACTAKLQRLNQLQKNTLQPKCKQRKMESKTRYLDSHSRVQKNRYKRGKSGLHKKISVNKKTKYHYYYVHVKNKKVGNDMSRNLRSESNNSRKWNKRSIERMSSIARRVNDASKERINSRERTDYSDNERVNDLKSEDERSEHSTIKTLKNPDTSIASLSTYNTFASLDQEPMVNMEL